MREARVSDRDYINAGAKEGDISSSFRYAVADVVAVSGEVFEGVDCRLFQGDVGLEVAIISVGGELEVLEIRVGDGDVYQVPLSRLQVELGGDVLDRVDGEAAVLEGESLVAVAETLLRANAVSAAVLHSLALTVGVLASSLVAELAVVEC